MSESRVLRIAKAAALGTGTIGAFGALLVGEGMWARRAIGTSDDRPPSPDGVYGADFGGQKLSVLVIGDSSIVGYGMTKLEDAPPAMLGEALAHVLDRPIQITSRAVVGAKTEDLHGQIDQGVDCEPDVTVIVVGANDVTHLRKPRATGQQLAHVVKRLKAMGSEVVVTTCPDLGTVRPLPQPLRAFARVWSRRLAEQQTVAAVWAGARTVSSVDLLGELFSEHADIMFGEDRFHPSREGYANLVGVIVAAVVATVRHIEPPMYLAQPRDTMPVEQAAHEAAQSAGAQVTKSGRWASLLRRRRGNDADAPEAVQQTA